MRAHSPIIKTPAKFEARFVAISGMILFVLAFLLFGNTMNHGWTMDDFPVVVNNPDLESLQAFWQNSQPGRPLREISLLFDRFFFGPESFGYHIQNIFWHGLNALLLLVFCRQLKMRRWASWAVALLFLCHPLQVEVVANVSHRKDSLMLAFAFLAMLSYVQFFVIHPSRKIWLCAVFFFSILSFMAKQTAIALPVLFWTYELCFVPSEDRFLARRPWVAWCVSISALAGVCWWVFSVGGYPVVRKAMQVTLAFHANYFGEDVLAAWVMMVLQSWASAFFKLLWPFGLAVEYVVSIPDFWFAPKIVGGIFLCIGLISSTLFAYRHRSPRMLFWLVWMVTIYLPVSNLLPLSYPVADRYVYAPSAGFFILAVLFADRCVANEWVKKAGLTIVVIVLCLLTLRQNRVWESSLTLYRHASLINPESVFVLNNLGWELSLAGETEQALSTLQRAVSVNPHYPRSWYNLGLLYERRGDSGKAITCYKNAIKKSKNLQGFEVQAEELRRHLLTQYGIRFQ